MATDNAKAIIRTGPYPELTWTAVIVGWAIGALIAISIGYAALILGFAIEGSELAAILGWGVLRGVMRRTSILENNINQTIASSVNGASSGIMFTVPALFIIAKTQGLESVDDFDPTTILLIILAVWHGAGADFDQAWWSFLFRWLHVLSGVMWIGILWYFNFVQIPNMPNIEADQRPAGVMGPGINRQNIFHRGDEGRVGLGRNDPVLAQMRFEVVFFSARPTVLK